MELLAQLVDIVLHLDRHLALLLPALGVWIYAALFLVIFAETGLVIAPFLPGDSLLFVAGALAAAGGMDITLLCGVLWVAAVAGDNTNYWIGRIVGPRAFRWERSRLFNPAALAKTQAFYARHGGKTIVIARFLPIVRTFAPFVAGIGRMRYARFLPIDCLGGAVWIGSMTLAGYWLGNQPFFKQNLSLVIVAIVAISLLPAAIAGLRRARRPAPGR